MEKTDEDDTTKKTTAVANHEHFNKHYHHERNHNDYGVDPKVFDWIGMTIGQLPNIPEDNEIIEEAVKLRGNNGEHKISRRSTLLTYTNAPVRYWIKDEGAKSYIIKLSTCFYALFMIIVGVVLELANLIKYGNEQVAHFKDLFLALYMYGVSCIVIVYCMFNVLMDETELKKIRRMMARLASEEEEPEMLTNTSTGSLYLRIGCVIFGLIGVVYYMLMALICIGGFEPHTANECNWKSITISVMAAIFVFLQMWFVYCNGKVEINGHAKNFVQLGLMHLFATNIWLWIRYVLYEEAQTIKEIGMATFDHNNGSSFLIHHHPHHEVCRGVQCIFGEFSEFMYTCVVEYTLICAGVAFVFWTNIGGEPNHTPRHSRMRKRNMITIDCSRTSVGLFLGFIFLIGTILSVALFNAYSANSISAQFIFLPTNIAFHVLAISVCVYAFWRMKVLVYKPEGSDDEDASAELLDQILLVVGLIGELVYCISGIFAFVNNSNKHDLSIMLFIVNVLRLIQVSIQSLLLMLGSRLKLDPENPKGIRYKPGKQIITLLVLINVAKFFLNIFEAQKAGVTEEVVQLYGSKSWALVVRGCSPLTIFFRFHSSVCFAEIWKKTFKVRRVRSRSVA